MNMTDGLKFLVVVVMYETVWKQSETLLSLTSCSYGGSVDLLVWDNSRVSTEDEVLSGALKGIFNSYEYVHSPENTALSKVYNCAASKEKYTHLVLLDQDSKVSDEYWRQLFTSCARYVDCDLFLPRVTSSGKLVSPGGHWFIKGFHLKGIDAGLIRSEGKVAITSGMVIRRSYIEMYRPVFNERLDLYGIDTCFMLDYSKRREFFCVLDYELVHDTVLWSRPAKHVMLRRFRNLRRSWMVVHEKNMLKLVCVKVYAILVSFKFAIRYKDIAFLK